MKHLLIVALVLLSVSCKKKQPPLSELNKNCSEAKEVSAAFLQEEQAGFPPYLYTDTDSIRRNSNVRFTALEENAEYTWYIGSEIITTKSFTRFFSSSLQGQTIPVTLVVKKKPNTICNPNDDGYDSITRFIYPTPYPITTSTSVDFGPTEGTFRVKADHLPDSFDITLDFHPQSPNGNVFDVYNYNGLGDNCVGTILLSGTNYRQFWFDDGTAVLNCDYLQGNAFWRYDNLMEMNFTTGGDLPNGDYDRYLNKLHYLGRRL